MSPMNLCVRRSGVPGCSAARPGSPWDMPRWPDTSRPFCAVRSASTRRHPTMRDVRPMAVLLVLCATACRAAPPADRVRVSGHVEATEVQVSAQGGGQLLELRVAEGDRVAAGDVIARLDTRDTELSLQRVRAERQQADAQVRLLRAGARREDIRQAGAQFQAANAEIEAAHADLTAAEADLARFEALLASNAGSRKQRDDALARRDVARGRLQAARERARAGQETVARLQAGTLHTDAGGEAIPGKVTFISPKAEFTPRNVQTAEERSRLVYRVKVSADNANGVMKEGMTVEAELRLQ